MIICQNCGSKIDLNDDKHEDEDSEENTIEKPEKFSIIPIKEIECSFSEKDKLGGGKYGVVYKGMLKGIKIALKCVQKPEKILEQYNMDITESSMERAGNVVNIQLEHLSKEQAICRQFYNPHLCLYLGATKSEDDQLILISEQMDTDLNKYIISHEKNIPSLYDRIKMAYHIACGMNWLFNKVKHFDLKPSNILLAGLDENGDWNNNSVCKIADFGLSIIASESQTNRGTPVYSSPEALKNQATSSKTDVFSFGWILLNLACWEDEKKLFSFLEENQEEDSKNYLIQFQSNEKQIAEYVNLRVKHKGLSPFITDLIIDCLKYDPEERPTFDQIVSTCNNFIFLNAVCPKKESVSAAFWKKYFMENRVLEHQVSLEKFILAINDYSVFSGDNFRVAQREISILECLFHNKVVNLQMFGRTVGFYGPIIPFSQFFDNLDQLLKKEWFYGNISQANTIKALTKQKKGTFLVRLSSRDDDFSYVLAYVNSSGNVTQTKILHNPEFNEWTLEQKKDHNSSMISKTSIIDVVDYLSVANKIKKPLDQPSLRIPYKVEESKVSNYYASINFENNYEMYGDSVDLGVLKNAPQDIFELMELEQKTLKSFSSNTAELNFGDFFQYLVSIPNQVDSNATQNSKEIISQRAKELKLEVLDISTSKEKRLDKLIKSFCYVFYGSLLTSGVKKNIKQWLQDNRNFLLGDKTIESLTYNYYCARPFSENFVWFDFCALIALSQVYKINIFIIISSVEKYIYRINSANSKRCIVFGLANPSNWISLLPQSIFKIINKKKKN